MRVSRLSPTNPQRPRCKTKQKKTIIDQCLLKCALPLQFVCSWVYISRSYYMCESIRTNAQESQPLLFRKKVLIQYIHCMEKNVLQTSCFVFCKKERKWYRFGPTRGYENDRIKILEIFKQIKMFLMKPESGFCPSI